MRACKQCNKPIPAKSYGLRSFCSTVCKAIYRREYLRQKKQQERQGKNVNNTDGYDNTYSTMSTIPDCLEQITDAKITLNPEDLRVAKECCNYEMKQVVGYCITLHEPYYGFKTECKDCFIFHCLKQALSRSKYGRITARTY